MNSKQLYFRLLSHVKPYWKAFALSILMMVLVAATEPAIPAFFKFLLDDGFSNPTHPLIRWLPFLLVAIFIFRGVVNFAMSYLTHWVSYHVITDLRSAMFHNLLRLPVHYFEENSSGTIASKVTYDVNNVSNTATSALTILVRDSFTIIGLLAWLLWLNWQLTIVSLVMAPLVFLVARYFSKRLRRASKMVLTTLGNITHIAEEAAVSHKVIKVYRGENYEETRFRQANDRYRGFAMRGAIAAAASIPLVQILASISVAIVTYFVLQEAINNQSSAGSFMSFLTAMLMLLAPIKRLISVNNTLQGGLAAAERVFEVIDHKSEDVDKKTETRKHEETTLTGTIRYKDVNFSYPGSAQKILSGINLIIHPGEHIALVGQSGSGKSTMTSLLPRFHDLKDGEISINGVPIKEIPLPQLRDQIALVSQDVRLFNDTIAHNIGYGKSDGTATDDEIEQSARLAHAWEFIETLPEGVHTLIGQNGIKLSGGQRQRIAIARALIKDAPILILDEATSALDTESEKIIQHALKTLMSGRTTLVIAHRLSTIEQADKIIVLQSGEIVESGTHTELLHNKGPYSYYYNLQFNESEFSI